MSYKRKRSEEREVESVSDKGFIALMQDFSEVSVKGFDSKAVKRAAAFLEHNYYEAALAESERVLAFLHKDAFAALAHLSDVAQASVLRGRAMLEPLKKKLAYQGEEDDIIVKTFRECRAAFSLALILSSENSEAKTELNRLRSLEVELFGEDGVSNTLALEELDDHQVSATANIASEPEAPSDSIEGNHASADRLFPDRDLVPKKSELDIIVVGAGASGIGVGMALVAHFGVDRDRILLLERGEHVGTSFRLWPKEMRFISPSFNQHGWTSSFDLNSISHGTSPAVHTLEEHPTGEQYAQYLRSVAADASLPIRFGTDVTKICPVGSPGDPHFEVHTKSHDDDALHGKEDSDSHIVFHCRFVIWAAGEFQYPKSSGIFPGADLCCHNSTVASWASHPGDDFVVIGGYESGIDAAVNLVCSSRPVTVLASSYCWKDQSRDPSAELAPHTRARLKQVLAGEQSGKLRLLGGQRVTKVEFRDEQYLVYVKSVADAMPTGALVLERENEEPSVFVTSSRPILAVGFEGSVSCLVKDLFAWEKVEPPRRDKNCMNAEKMLPGTSSSEQIILTEVDESTTTEGLFLVGPQITHEGLVFCFIYKFRQRFAVVAAEVARRLGKDTRMGVMTCRSADMFLDDFVGIHACCGEADDR